MTNNMTDVQLLEEWFNEPDPDNFFHAHVTTAAELKWIKDKVASGELMWAHEDMAVRNNEQNRATYRKD